MNTSFARSMARATELTRSGKLEEATALIQSLLRPGDQPKIQTVAESDLIEGRFERLGDSTAAHAADQTAARPAARKGLAETLRSIAEGGIPLQAGPVAQPADLPKGAQILALTHWGVEGSRDYRLYIPAHTSAAPLPLVIMLHGYTQTPEDFAIGTGMNALAEEFGCLVAWPAQPHGANVQNC